MSDDTSTASPIDRLGRIAREVGEIQSEILARTFDAIQSRIIELRLLNLSTEESVRLDAIKTEADGLAEVVFAFASPPPARDAA